MSREAGVPAQQLLSGVFSKVYDNFEGDLFLSCEKVNNFLSSNENKLVLFSPSEFSMIVLAMNNSNLYRPQKVGQSTFVNYFLPPNQRALFTHSAVLNNIIEQSKSSSVDNSIKQIFDQMRPTLNNDVFLKSFNADPRVVQHHLSMIQQQPNNSMSLTPQNVFGPKNSDRSLTRIVVSGNLKQSNVDSYTPNSKISDYDKQKIIQDHLKSLQANAGPPVPSPVIQMKFGQPSIPPQDQTGFGAPTQSQFAGPNGPNASILPRVPTNAGYPAQPPLVASNLSLNQRNPQQTASPFQPQDEIAARQARTPMSINQSILDLDRGVRNPFQNPQPSLGPGNQPV